MSWGEWDEPAVVLSGGPVRVVTDDPDPDYHPPPMLVFRYDPRPVEDPRAEHFKRLRASTLVLHQPADARWWYLVAHEPVAIADQLLEDGWGDQA